MEARDVEKAATEAVIMLGYSNLKELQMAVIVSFVMGRDVFGILPTGYGKTLCYQCLPLIFDKLKSGSTSSSSSPYSYHEGSSIIMYIEVILIH